MAARKTITGYTSLKWLGADALIEAALKADELLDGGDIDGQAVSELVVNRPKTAVCKTRQTAIA